MAEVDHYGPLVECRPTFGDGLTVLSGPNEAGKTLYLEALLRLLEPGISDVLSPSARVSDPPRGRVLVEHDGEKIECTGATSLCANSVLEPRHLQSIFVVQDTDLALPGSQEYYASIVETLGDIHTTELDRITSALKDRGRLTRKTLSISDDSSNHKAKTVRSEAADIAEEIDEYVARIQADDIDQLAGRRLRVRRQLEQAREDLNDQKHAKAVAEYTHLTSQLQTYREATETLQENEAIDRETLEDLRELETNLEHARDELSDTRATIEATEAEVETCESRLRDLSQQIADLERREQAVQRTTDELEAYRERTTATERLDRRLGLLRLAMGGSAVGAGIAGGAGAFGGGSVVLAVAVVLLGTAIAAGLLHWRTNTRLASIESAREETLHQARDAGFSVETIDDVGTTIEDFQSTLTQVRESQVRTEQQLDTATTNLDTLRSEEEDLESRIAELESDLQEELDDAGVDSIQAYEAEVDRLEDLQADRQTARQSLIDRFGEPATDDPLEAVTVWEDQLDALVRDLDTAEIGAEDYKEQRLQELEDRVQSLESDLTDLEERLDEHDDTLDEFDERATALRTEPFIDQSLSLPARTTEGLKALAEALRDVVDEIEHDADISRKALKLFDRIESQEEQKMTELFDPDGPASQTFAQLTDGRYREVAYDPDANGLTVKRSDGQTFAPELLSQGTTDQLYFASRVSLARQLLGEEAGFLLLDDPFMAADYDRLHRGFETLQELATDGWQILYLTAKRDVAESMVAEFDLDHGSFDSISRRS